MTIFVTRVRMKVKQPQVASVYCRKPSPPGNPFMMGNERMKDAVCDQYEEWFETRRSGRISDPAFKGAGQS